MKELAGLAVGVLFTAIIIMGGTTVIEGMTGQPAVNVPGYYEGTNLTAEIEDSIGTFKETTEDDSSIGVGGLVSLIKKVLFGIPEWASSLVYGIVGYLHLPILLADITRAVFYILFILTIGILLLRGVIG